MDRWQLRVTLSTNIILGADGFNAVLFAFFQNRQLLLFVKAGTAARDSLKAKRNRPSHPVCAIVIPAQLSLITDIS